MFSKKVRHIIQLAPHLCLSAQMSLYPRAAPWGWSRSPCGRCGRGSPSSGGTCPQSASTPPPPPSSCYKCNVRQGTRRLFRLFSQDLCLCSSLVASSRCSSFNSFTVAVSHLTLSKSVIVSLPRHNIPVTVSKNKIFFKQHVELFSDFNSTTVRHSFVVFDQPRHWSFLKSMSRFSE